MAKLKNRKAILMLFTANAISGIAQGISMIAVPLYFIKVVDQESLWTFSLALVLLLGLFWRLYAGALVDGFKRKDVFLGTSFFAGLIVFAVAALGFAIEHGYTEGFIYSNNSEQLGQMFSYFSQNDHINGFLTGVEEKFPDKLGEAFFYLGSGQSETAYIFSGFKGVNGEALGPQLPTVLPVLIFATTLFVYFIHFPNLFAFIQEIEDQRNYGKLTRLVEVIGQITALSAGFATAILMSGKLGDWHFEPWKIHQVFMLNGITYVLAFVIILFVKYKLPERTIEQQKAKQTGEDAVTVGESLKIGMAYLRKHPVIFVFGLLSSAIFISYMTMLWGPIMSYVDNHLGEGKEVIGYVEVFLAVGALGCAILVNRLFKDMSIPKVILILTVLITICYVIMIVTQSKYILFPVAILIGFTNAGSRIYRVMYLFGEVPNRLIGRVQSIINIPQTLIPVALLFLFGTELFVHNILLAFIVLAVFTLVNAISIMVIYKKVTKEGSV